MCGLAGFVDLAPRHSAAELAATVRAMADALHHRGPDGDGVWTDAAAGVALGHRRLAIIDLSPAGHQPMHSVSGRFVIAYNGEIYNFRTLRRELEALGHAFRGHSDTEVLLAAFEQWELDSALQKLAGMFAFALWDRRLQVLHLVRDRLGKKPLYFGWAGQAFVFGSELKAIHQHPSFVPAVDRTALTLLLRHGHIPAPYAIWQGFFKLPTASRLSLVWNDAAAIPRDRSLLALVHPYWRLCEIAAAGMLAPLELSDAEAGERLEHLLDQAVSERMIADVPLGALLSGGIDSSSVVALMQKHAVRPTRTFSIAFREAGYNEATNAAAVARHLGTDHTELVVTPQEAQAVIPRLPEIYDEPFADQSQVPTFAVAQLARQSVTVALSGDGGDEVFGGYNRHLWGPRLWRWIRFCPPALRRAMAGALTAVPPDRWDAAAACAGGLWPSLARQPMVGYYAHKMAGALNVDGPESLYRRLTMHWEDAGSVVRQAGTPPTEARPAPARLGSLERMIYHDMLNYLPNDVLVKVDRASMAVSLEVRSPLLDHRIVEFAWYLPAAMKIRHGQGKWLLRQLLYRYVPRALVDRPKQGFAMPLDAWLRGPLRDWAEALLERRSLEDDGFFDPALICQAWADHLSGRYGLADRLWPVLMFQAWRVRWSAPGGAVAAEHPLTRCRAG